MTNGPQGSVDVEVETLATFRDRVNGLLTSLDTGPAAPGRIADQQLTADHLGTGFQEVGRLMARYQLVHQQLQDLSQTLTNQIDAMGITVQVSQVGYRNVEADQVASLWQIQSRTAAQQPPASQMNLTVDQQIAAAKAGTPPAAAASPGTAASSAASGDLGN
jgi:hypothetical protein